MSELTFLVLRLGFLVLLWLFVFSVLFALRSDLFGSPAKKIKNKNEEVYRQPVVQAAAVGASGAATSTARNADPLPSAGTIGPAKKLVVLTGIAAGSTISLDSDTVTIGRSPDSTLVIVDEYTSTYHARLDRNGDGWSITDLDSTNGTKLEGAKITAKTPLPPYKQVTIGTTSFELRP